MAMSGTEKDIRMQSSWSSDSLDHNNNHHQQQEHPSDRFPIAGAVAGAAVMPISVGSKLKSPTRYRECLKNHAASIGGNVTDGCGEFMPSGDDGTLEALKCAACNCHRNFHRKESSSYGESADFSRSTAIHPLPLPLPAPLPSPSAHKHRPISVGMHSNHWTSIAPPVKIAFGGGSAGTDSSSEELNFNAGAAAPYGSSKKRFRTKFRQEQKEKMMEFAEKVGWRIPREDDVEVQRFCGEIGVKRQVLKVWMHNNKNNNSASALKNKQPQESYGD